MPDIGNGVRLLSEGAGYGMLVGLGILFCLVILVAVKIQKAYLLEDSMKSEMFLVANRSVGTGLTASAVFSSWMWINETVFACVVCYQFGLAAPVWFGSGLAFQIALMAVLGVLAKIRVPYAHTSLEFIKRRYGRSGHAVFILLNLINNVLGCSSMIVAGSQVLVGISGINLAAATILLPLGVVLYTAVGGLKATFITDYLHTSAALILIIYFTLGVLTNEHIGGLYGLYDKVKALGPDDYIKGNYKGSLLSFKSKGSIMFGLVLKFGNLALVTMDTAFWQKSFASDVKSTVPGYDLAALAIFAVPWGLGTVIGLSARVIHTLPIFPTYPNPFSVADIDAGLVMPYTIKALLGTGGEIGMVFLLFMAVTSTVSSSMIAVSSIISFDMYRTYVNPKATDHQIVHASHLGVVFHGCFIAGIALALNYGGANINWLNYMSPILTCPGIFPLMFTLFWSGQTKAAAVIAPILGLITGIGVWLGSTHVLYGPLTILSTSEQAPALYGAIGSLFSPIVYSLIISYAKPSKFDWREFLRIDIVEDQSGASTPTAIMETSEAPSGTDTPVDEVKLYAEGRGPEEKGSLSSSDKSASILIPRVNRLTAPLDELVHPFAGSQMRELWRWYKIAWAFLIFIILITWVVWPMPLYRDYVFTKSFFAGWTTVAIIWQFFAFGAVAVYPLYDGRNAIAKAYRGIRQRFT